MKLKASTAAVSLFAMLAISGAAQAASTDYLLKIDGIPGDVAVTSWSFGVCNAGHCTSGSTMRTIQSPRDAASGLSTGKRQHKPVATVQASQNTQSLRESPTRASTGGTAVNEAPAEAQGATPRGSWDLATNKGARTASGVNVAVGDVNGDGRADLAFAGTQDEVSELTLAFDKASPILAKVCGGKHIARAVLRSGEGESFEVSDAQVACTTTDGGATQLVIQSGQMKHTKTGHVTLLK